MLCNTSADARFWSTHSDAIRESHETQPFLGHFETTVICPFCELCSQACTGACVRPQPPRERLPSRSLASPSFFLRFLLGVHRIYVSSCSPIPPPPLPPVSLAPPRVFSPPPLPPVSPKLPPPPWSAPQSLVCPAKCFKG